MIEDISALRRCVERQSFDELKTACLALLDKDADHRAARVLLALAYARLGEGEALDESMALVEAHFAQYDLDTLCDLAAVYMACHQIDKARVLLDKLLADAPEHDLALARLAWCCMTQGDAEQALALFERAVRLAPWRMTVHLNRLQLRLSLLNDTAIDELIAQAFACLQAQRDEWSDTVFDGYETRLYRLQLQWWVSRAQYAAAEQWLTSLKDSADDQPGFDEDKAVFWGKSYATLLAEHDQHGIAESYLKDLLQAFPDNVTLLLALSELAQVQGLTIPAMAYIRRAIAQDKDNSALWVNLSSACLHSLATQARHAAEKAVALADAMVVGAEHSVEKVELCRLQAKNALAMVESDALAFDKAEALFRDVLAERPYFVPALSGLGHQLMQQGQIDEAVALFEKIKEIDPTKGYSALINARRFPDDVDTLEKLEKAAKLPSMEGSMRSSLLFQLAAAWEKRKDYHKAFAMAEQANTASLRFLKYDPKDHRNRCARMRYAFSASLYEHRADCGVASTLPVFVLGMPRSGTTLVEQIIAGHSDIFGAGELGVIPNVIQGLNRWERHVGSGRQFPDCIDDVDAYVCQGIANNVLKELQAYAPEAKHIVDKLPHNFENIGLIKFLFPNARIISVRRDPRDIALSNYFTDYQAKHGGMGFAYDMTHIGEQLADHNLLMHHWNQVFPNQILEIHYEDVVENLEGSARKMLDYIGVEWQPEVLKFNELERSVKTASVWQVRQPLYKTSKAKWMNYQDKLAPLIRGTNAKIEFDPIEMLTLPVPGFLTTGVAHFHKGELDEAETCFKKMLHHNPSHAACQYMTGLVYFRKNHMEEGIKLVESALEALPWQKEWRDNLIKAYERTGQTDKAAALTQKGTGERSALATASVPASHHLADGVEDEELFPLVGSEQYI
ncbi:MULTISPECIES: tetratricopeptide repeat-containing sulfotransferase family protein [Marinomonas]|uniref:Sulfotransferase n=1 Tax=Marinomonas arctica TaxID=383750 RepID=A0A7H1J2H8_9GAMM|nr:MULTISPECIES: tetratricopeptide repeat-containing sulfotransferase family protein [Marinomonas]QNT04694.1 sulfotransferase [Marinomonas arctica]GGN32316.1 hypothetical protein GCM10011350_26690 [Marinomonas arctica]